MIKQVISLKNIFTTIYAKVYKLQICQFDMLMLRYKMIKDFHIIKLFNKKEFLNFINKNKCNYGGYCYNCSMKWKANGFDVCGNPNCISINTIL